MASTTTTKTIAKIERLRLSVMGNPQMRVTFTDGTVAKTQQNASVAYGIENPEFRDVPVHVTFNRYGSIVDVAIISTPAS